jgi:hypothetical protein
MPNGAKKAASNLLSLAVLSLQKLLILASRKAYIYTGNFANLLASSRSISVYKAEIVQ